MNQKAYKALEYYKIINMLTDKASSSMGKEICRKLEPSTDIDEIRHMQTQTRDALTRLYQKGNIAELAEKIEILRDENVRKMLSKTIDSIAIEEKYGIDNFAASFCTLLGL